MLENAATEIERSKSIVRQIHAADGHPDVMNVYLRTLADAMDAMAHADLAIANATGSDQNRARAFGGSADTPTQQGTA